jgi:hypothetical protein
MDDFEIGQGTPSFQLQILESDPFIRRKGLVTVTVHRLILLGAQGHQNFLTVVIPAEGMYQSLTL